MTDLYIKHISAQLGVNLWQAMHCVELLEEGATIPFISRYRKERTGGMDEVQVAQVKHYFQYFTELDKRKAAILKSIEEQEALTPELRTAIEGEIDSTALEDLYLPYRPKKRTRASVARERGLEPLADAFMSLKADRPRDLARKYINADVPDEFMKGLELIHKKMENAFEKLHVVSFGERGDKFDPDFHNAISRAADLEIEEDHIVEVYQKGYMIGDRIIRHAMVQIAD